ncbi:hypothetical protein DPEC_G00230020 [Dallia pectoralis]|uniref:Uncharacterized protein n=1 Tax=Dallia pectoralis TaxID=75939 RepID=A0ACC2G206_DALPE|nr:hypothetical protein DPEC_G00230020 [Dallia pectoralis]
MSRGREKRVWPTHSSPASVEYIASLTGCLREEDLNSHQFPVLQNRITNYIWLLTNTRLNMSAPNINSGNKTSDEEIWSGMKFHDANQDPVKLKGYDAHLQLFVSEGVWPTHSSPASVEYIASLTGCLREEDLNSHQFPVLQNRITNYIWLLTNTRLNMSAPNINSGNKTSDEEIWSGMKFHDANQDPVKLKGYDAHLQLFSSMLMFDGVQARFILTSGDELARTPRWVSQRPVRVPIKDEPALLQIYNNTGYASARLYIKKTFNDWKNTFYYSWVGFYADGDKNDDEYNNNRWQWAVKFTKDNDSKCDEYDVYEYQSGMPLSSGVQARFMLKSGDRRAHTAPWNDIGK